MKLTTRQLTVTHKDLTIVLIRFALPHPHAVLMKTVTILEWVE
jgi:hypothetical protein